MSKSLPTNNQRAPLLFQEASIILKKVSEGGSYKSLIFNNKSCNPQGLAALVSKASQYRSLIDRVISSTHLLDLENNLDIWLVRILVAQICFGGNQHLGGNNAAVKIVLKNRRQILEAVEKEDIYGVRSLRPNRVGKPRYVRVNTLKISTDDFIKMLKTEGYGELLCPDTYDKFLELVEDTLIDQKSDKIFMRDFHVKDMLVFPKDAFLIDHPAYKEGKIVLQDKASCMQSCCFRPPPGSVVLDMCAAPGMKTSLYAAMVGNKGTVHAIERQQNRYDDMVNIVTSLGASCVKAIHNDAGLVGPDICENVEYIVVDPSCSGSGMQGRSTLEDVELQFLPKDHPSRVQSAANLQRIQKLQNLQTYLLKHALSNFPSAKCVVYSTCSTDSLENEAVVSNCLNCARLNGFEVLDCRSIMKGWKHFGHPSYDCGERTVYTRETDLMNGGFFAVFERRKVVDIEEEEEEEEVVVQELEGEEGEVTRLAIKLLDPKPGSVILNMASSFNILDSTLTMAAKMQNVGKIYVFNGKRLKSAGLECAVVKKGSVLSSSDANCPGVESVLVFPESSGSSKSHPSADPKVIHQKFVCKQFSQLRHALTSFPHAKRIIYATESIHAAENEAVIDALLVVAKFHGFILADATMMVAESGWENTWCGSCRQSEYHCGEKCLMRQEEDGSGMFVAIFERNVSAKDAGNGRDGQVKRSFDDEGNDGSGDFGDPEGTSRKGNYEGTFGSSGKSGKTKRQKTGKGSGNLGSSGGVNGRTTSVEDSASLLEMTDVESLGSSVSSDDFPGEFSFGTGFVANLQNFIDDSSFEGSSSVSRSKSGAELANLPNFVDVSSFEGSASVSSKSKSGADLTNLPNFVDDSSLEGSVSGYLPNLIDVPSLEGSVSVSEGSIFGADSTNSTDMSGVASFGSSVGLPQIAVFDTDSAVLPNMTDIPSLMTSSADSRVVPNATDVCNSISSAPKSAIVANSVVVPNMANVPSLRTSSADSRVATDVCNSVSSVPNSAALVADAVILPKSDSVSKFATASGSNLSLETANTAQFPEATKCPDTPENLEFDESSLNTECDNSDCFRSGGKSLLEVPDSSANDKSLLEVPDVPSHETFTLGDDLKNNPVWQSIMTKLEKAFGLTSPIDLPLLKTLAADSTFMAKLSSNFPCMEKYAEVPELSSARSEVESAGVSRSVGPEIVEKTANTTFSRFVGLDIADNPVNTGISRSADPEITKKSVNTTFSRFVGLDIADNPVNTGISRSADPEITEKSVNTTFSRSAGPKLPNTKLARSKFTNSADEPLDTTFLNPQTFVPTFLTPQTSVPTFLNPQTFVPTPTSSSLPNCPPVFKASPDDFFIFNNRGNDQCKNGVNNDDFGTLVNRPVRKRGGMRLRSGRILRGDPMVVRPERESTRSKSEKKKKKSKSEKRRNRRKMSEGENCSNNGNKIPKIAENLDATNVVYSNMENCSFGDMNVVSLNMENRSLGDSNAGSSNMENSLLQILTGSKFFVIVGKGKNTDVVTENESDNLECSRGGGEIDETVIKKEPDDTGSGRERECWCDVTKHYFGDLGGGGGGEEGVGEHRTKKKKKKKKNKRKKDGGVEGKNGVQNEEENCGKRKETKNIFQWWKSVKFGRWKKSKKNVEKKKKDEAIKKKDEEAKTENKDVVKKRKRNKKKKKTKEMEKEDEEMKDKNKEAKKNDNDEEKKKKKKNEEAKKENNDVKKKNDVMKDENEEMKKNVEAKKENEDVEKKKNKEIKINVGWNKKKIILHHLKLKDAMMWRTKNLKKKQKKEEAKKKNEEMKRYNQEAKEKREMMMKMENMKKKEEAKKKNEEMKKKEEAKNKNEEMKKNHEEAKEKREMTMKMENMKNKEETKKKNKEMKKNHEEAKEKRGMMMKMENMKKKEEARKKNDEMKKNYEKAKEKREMTMKMENMKNKEETKKKNKEMKKNNEESKEKREMTMKMEKLKNKEEAKNKNEEMKKNNEAKEKRENQKKNLIFHLLKLNKNEESKKKRNLFLHLFNVKKKDEEMKKKNNEMKKNEEVKGLRRKEKMEINLNIKNEEAMRFRREMRDLIKWKEENPLL